MNTRKLATRIVCLIMLPLLPLIAYGGSWPGAFRSEMRRSLEDWTQMLKTGKL